MPTTKPEEDLDGLAIDDVRDDDVAFPNSGDELPVPESVDESDSEGIGDDDL